MLNNIKNNLSSELNKIQCIGKYKNKLILGVHIPKNGCSTFTSLFLKYYNKDTPYEPHNNYWSNVYSLNNKRNINYYKDNNMYIVCVYRDTIDRFLSAKETLRPNSTFDEYIKEMQETIKKYKYLELDHHLIPQYLYMNKFNIDLYINIKDLTYFLEDIGLEQVHLNKSIHNEVTIKDVPADIIKYYNDDITYINNLPIEKIYSSKYKIII